MSIKDAKLKNLNLNDSNFQMGAGYDPLKLEKSTENTFCKIVFDY